MNRIRARFKRFWLEEEVPRWIGIPLVTAYLCGLAGVTYVAHRQTVELAEQRMVAHSDHAMSLLAKVLSGIDETDVKRQQVLLRMFSRRLDCEHLYVADGKGMVIASIDAEEVGQPRPLTQVVEVDGGGDGGVNSEGGDVASHAGSVGFALAADEPNIIRRYYRLPIAAGGSGAPRALQGIFRWDTTAAASSGQAWLLVVVLVAVGVLGIVYHLMRRHFRGVSCIADNLMTHGHRLEEELASLRVADSLGTVACSWNKLIDLVESFRVEAGRSTAASELRQVLERSSSGELVDAIDAVPDGLFMIADEDLLVHCNAAAVRLMGWNQGEAREGEGGGERKPAARARLRELESSETGRAVLEVVEKARGADGSYAGHNELVECGGSNYRVRVVPQQNSRQHGAAVVVITDVSQQVRADRARQEFVSQVTHELRTPLTNIRAYSETLSSGMFDDPKVVSECYNVINKETRRLSRLVEDILSMSQLEVGSIQILLDDVDPRALIQEAVRDVRATADEKNIDLQAILPAKIDPIQADKDKLAVVLNNLLGNALKYTPRDGEVRVGCQATEGHLLITVKDNGIGIDKAEQEHMFEKFHRSEDPQVQVETGTGIGLTTAREIARRHGGDIELMSEKGKGSTFVVKLPKPKSVVTGTASAVGKRG